MKKALITGVNGQDGSFLAEYLLELDYQVYGIVRRSSVNNLERLEKVINNENFKLLYGDLTDSLCLMKIINEVKPDEIYNLAAQSDVGVSFVNPEYTTDVDGLGLLRILDVVHTLKMDKKCKIYQSSTSELYGENDFSYQDENTPFNPSSPYACAKLYAYNISEVYKKSYGMFICNGILFNHESERRGEEFVTRKITLAAVRISLGLQDKLYLGNLYAKRDWGYAKDYVKMMHRMLQNDKCDNYVIATGKQYTIKEFCCLAFSRVGIDIIWKNSGINEVGIDSKSKKIIIEIKKDFYRPLDVNNLIGNPEKAIKELDFNPNSTTISELVDIMIKSDMERVNKYEKKQQDICSRS